MGVSQEHIGHLIWEKNPNLYQNYILHFVFVYETSNLINAVHIQSIFPSNLQTSYWIFLSFVATALSDLLLAKSWPLVDWKASWTAGWSSWIPGEDCIQVGSSAYILSNPEKISTPLRIIHKWCPIFLSFEFKMYKTWDPQSPACFELPFYWLKSQWEGSSKQLL